MGKRLRYTNRQPTVAKSGGLHRAHASGFTMIEVIAVLVVVGIVAAVIVSRGISTTSYSVSSESEILKTHLRFAQIKALSGVSPNTWGINIGASSYTLVNNYGATAKLPGEDAATHSFVAAGVTATAVNVTFDDWGSPGVSAITTTLTGGSDTKTVTVTQNTGFIP